MPAESGKQYRYMQMIKHGKGPAAKRMRSTGPSKKVAEEFIKATPKKKRSAWSKKKKRSSY